MNNYQMDLAIECLDNLHEIRRANDNGHILNLVEIAIRAVDKVIIGIEDDVNILSSAINYLKKHQQGT